MSTVLDQIVRAKKREVPAKKSRHSVRELRRMSKDAPPVRSFVNALSAGFGLIAEVKRKSPSIGFMREENFAEAPAAYERSPIVKAVSVLTDEHFFGMGIEWLEKIKSKTIKPILRKDFILSEYQIYESRAFGADAILLMASILSPEKLQRFFALARELGMDVLFEAHTKEEIETIPSDAAIIGINSRKFMSRHRRLLSRYVIARAWAGLGARLFPASQVKDLSTEISTFEKLVSELPARVIKVAESGVRADGVAAIRELGFDAVLVGTALLRDQRGVAATLREVESNLTKRLAIRPVPQPA